MPLSFRRSYRKRPILELDEHKRRAAGPEADRTVRSSEEFRPTRYPLGIPILAGTAIGLCIFVTLARGFNPSVWMPVPPADPGGLATSAFETALAVQLGTLAAPSLTPPAPALQAQALVQALAASATPAAIMGASTNPWAEAVPEAACIPADIPQTGRVVEVVDGDTVRVLMDSDGRVYSVRYLGATAPDVGSSLGRQALARNIELSFRGHAILVRDITDADINGTLLRYVLVENVFLNHRMIAEGLAQAELASPDTACLGALLSAQQAAQASALGIWQPAPTVP